MDFMYGGPESSKLHFNLRKLQQTENGYKSTQKTTDAE